MNNTLSIHRRDFAKSTLLVSAVVASGTLPVFGADSAGRRVRVGLIGCGSVSGQYLPQLKKCRYAEVVSLCDRKPERAKGRAEQFGVANHYPNVEAMLAGVPFEFLIDTTDMQEHEGINRRALEAGKHVWSEKPIANTLATGQELLRMAKSRNLRLWGAPITVQSPQGGWDAWQPPTPTTAMRGPTGPPSSMKNWAARCLTSPFII